MVRNYAEAHAFLNEGRSKNYRPLSGRATRMIRRDAETIALQYHETDVVTYKADGRVILNSGGWRTPTTKARMNEFSPLGVSQSEGIWYVSTNGFDSSLVFQDGVTFHKGKITHAGKSAKAQIELRKRIRKFAGEYMRKLAAGEIPEPSNGDCWGCLMQTDKGEHPLGGQDHILSHLADKYYVPSLIANAFKAFGAAQVQWWGLGSLWGKTENAESYRQCATDARARRMLTRWLYRECGLVS